MAVTVVGFAPETVKTATCRHCGVKLEYLPIDVKRRDGVDYSGGSDGCEWIDCPRCMKYVIIRSW